MEICDLMEFDLRAMHLRRCINQANKMRRYFPKGALSPHQKLPLEASSSQVHAGVARRVYDHQVMRLKDTGLHWYSQH